MKIKYVLLASVILIVGCKTESIKPPQEPSGASSPPSGSQSPSGESGEQSSESSSSSKGSSGEVGTFPQTEMPGSEIEAGSEVGSVGETHSTDEEESEDGESTSDCGDTGVLPGGIGGMGREGECLGGGAASNNEETSTSSDGGTTGTDGAGSVGQYPAESSEERVAGLSRKLEESVGGFDEVLLEEQREIASVGRNTEGFGDGSGGGGGIVDLGVQSSGGAVSVVNTGISKPESSISGMTDQEIRERTPDDIPTLVNDDIISKQLREAALTEDDPELRERLWEEYRKFKDL